MSFRPRTEADRQQAISLTQAAIERLREAVGDDCRFDARDARVKSLLKRFPLGDQREVLVFVQRNFRAKDVQSGLGVNDNNIRLTFAQLSRLVKALN